MSWAGVGILECCVCHTGWCMCTVSVYTGEVCRQESEHPGAIGGFAGWCGVCTHWDLSVCPWESLCSGLGVVCTWHHLCFGGGLGKPSAELGSAVPSLVAKSLKSLPFQQQLSRRRSSSDLGREGWGAEQGALRGRRWAGVRGCGEGLVGLEEGSPLGDGGKDKDRSLEGPRAGGDGGGAGREAQSLGDLGGRKGGPPGRVTLGFSQSWLWCLHTWHPGQGAGRGGPRADLLARCPTPCRKAVGEGRTKELCVSGGRVGCAVLGRGLLAPGSRAGLAPLGGISGSEGTPSGEGG